MAEEFDDADLGVERLGGGEAINALSLDLRSMPLPATEVRSGLPRAGAVDVDAGPGYSFGVWEMTTGTAVDVESDECFVVLAGRATVTISGEEGAADQVLELASGSIGRLTAGMRTEWVIHEDLRKVYILPTS